MPGRLLPGRRARVAPCDIETEPFGSDSTLKEGRRKARETEGQKDRAIFAQATGFLCSWSATSPSERRINLMFHFMPFHLLLPRCVGLHCGAGSNSLIFLAHSSVMPGHVCAASLVNRRLRAIDRRFLILVYQIILTLKCRNPAERTKSAALARQIIVNVA